MRPRAAGAYVILFAADWRYAAPPHGFALCCRTAEKSPEEKQVRLRLAFHRRRTHMRVPRPHRNYDKVTDITPQRALGVSGVLLDIDGTLMRTKDAEPSAEIIAYAARCAKRAFCRLSFPTTSTRSGWRALARCLRRIISTWPKTGAARLFGGCAPHVICRPSGLR